MASAPQVTERTANGTAVRITGLVKAPEHNGKVGTICRKRKAPEGRVGVDLGGGNLLCVKRENLELVSTIASVTGVDGETKFTRDNGLLDEFNGNPDPDVLALYWHMRDQEFDCYNAVEYGEQMLRYYTAGWYVAAVVPRQIRADEHLLVCLRSKENADQNGLCQVAFQCMRQFAGISILVKKRCIVCHRPGAPWCSCKCVSVCPDCQDHEIARSHRRLCKLVQASDVVIVSEDEAIQLL